MIGFTALAPGATPVVLIYSKAGDEGVAYTLRVPDGQECVSRGDLPDLISST